MLKNRFLRSAVVVVLCGIPTFFAGVWLKDQIDAGSVPPLVSRNDKVHVHATDELVPANIAGVFRVSSTINFENISDETLAIQVPLQVAFMGWGRGGQTWEIGADIADRNAVELPPGKKHAIKFGKTILAKSPYGLSYYQLVVLLNGVPNIVGCQARTSEL